MQGWNGAGLCHRSHHPYHGAACGLELLHGRQLVRRGISHHHHPVHEHCGALIAAMGFVDNLAKVGTIVGSVDEILLKPGRITEHNRHSWEDRISPWIMSPLGMPRTRRSSTTSPHHSGRQPHRFGLDPPVRASPTIAKPHQAGFWDVTEGPHYPGRGGKPYPAGTTLCQVAFCFSGQLPL